MTYKHINFFDSPTMRSLERLAHEKGLVKKEFVKKASINEAENFYASTNLTENILKLCAGLSKKGFHSFASEIEDNFVQYKQAQTLYETSKEKGEDLVHDAHPKGSHKLKDVDSKEAVFEDILDRHLKMLNVINKNPSGKLSNAQSVINAVKMIFAQSYQDVKDQVQQAYDKTKQAYNIAANSGNLNDSTLSWAKGRVDLINSLISKDGAQVNVNTIEKIKDAISALQRNFHPDLLHNVLPDFLTKGLTDDAVWGKVNDLLNEALTICSAAQETSKNLGLNIENTTQKPAEVKQVPTENNSKDDLTYKLEYLQKLVDLYKQRVKAGIEPDKQAPLLTWLDDQAGKFITTALANYNSSDKSDPYIQKQFMAKYELVKSKLDAFNQKWFV